MLLLLAAFLKVSFEAVLVNVRKKSHLSWGGEAKKNQNTSKQCIEKVFILERQI